METSKDLILRQIKIFSDFLMALTKQKPLETEEIDVYIDEFTLKYFNETLEELLKKQVSDIVEIIEGHKNRENIKDFTEILFIKYLSKKDSLENTLISQKIIELYQIYQNESNIYSFDIQLKINQLRRN